MHFGIAEGAGRHRHHVGQPAQRRGVIEGQRTGAARQAGHGTAAGLGLARMHADPLDFEAGRFIDRFIPAPRALSVFNGMRAVSGGAHGWR